MEISVLVESTHAFFPLKLAGEQFVPNGNVFTGEESNFKNTPVMWRGVSCFYLRIE